MCGELLARGHARSGDPLVIAGYLGSGGGICRGAGQVRRAYADQTEKDWEELKRSRKAGKKRSSFAPAQTMIRCPRFRFRDLGITTLKQFEVGVELF